MRAVISMKITFENTLSVHLTVCIQGEYSTIGDSLDSLNMLRMGYQSKRPLVKTPRIGQNVPKHEKKKIGQNVPIKRPHFSKEIIRGNMGF